MAGKKTTRGTARRTRGTTQPRRPGRAVSDATRRRLEKALAEAREQQAATGEILRVIAGSPHEAQPVFDTIAKSAARLCAAQFCHVYRFDGKLLHFAAHYGLTRESFEIGRKLYPLAPSRGTAAARSILSGQVEQIPDTQAETGYAHAAFAKAVRYRSIVAVPMVRDGVTVGAIAVARSRVGPFPPRQIELLRTFADQAVIAIENVRLFKELGARNRDLTEALEQQTATSDILRVISQSPTDVQPVFDTIVASALKLCRTDSANVLSFDGRQLQLAALANTTAEGAEAVRKLYPRAIGRDSAAGRAVLTRAVAAVTDVLEDPEYATDAARARAAAGFRSVVSMPLMREGSPIGAINVGRREPGPFPDTQIALLKTFAAQAVIAIENVRLFKELGARNRDLTEALEQQTATSEILRVISRSPTDVQPVFDAIAERAATLCGARFAFVTSFDGEWIHMRATYGPHADEHRAGYPIRPGAGAIAGRVVQDCATVQIEDMLADREYAHKEAATHQGFRSGLGVPMMRNGQVLGCIALTRPETGAFPERLVRLLETFADQAVIAVENVRLFNETKEALDQQTATAEILQAISRSPGNLQPVFDTLVHAAARFCAAPDVAIMRLDGGVLRGVAAAGQIGEVLRKEAGGIEAVELGFDRRSVSGRAACDCRTVHVHDLAIEPEEEYPVGREMQRRLGHHTTAAAPLLREGKALGVIVLFRTEVRPFSDKQLQLLRIFADQAVIAIENVRLFTELGARNRDLTEALEHQTATAEILGVISSSPTDVQPVFDIIGERAERLCEAEISVVTRVDGGMIHLASVRGVDRAGADAIRRHFPADANAGSLSARAFRSRAVVHVEDVLADPEYDSKDAAVAAHWRGSLAVPMLREGQVIGTIFVAKTVPGRFSESKVELLKTFADQAVIDIENVRLFTELGVRNHDLVEALEQQTATSEILGVISKSQTDVQPVFDTIARAARELCRATSANVFTYDGELVYAVAVDSPNPQYVETIHQVYPRRPGRETGVARAIETRRVVMIPDVLADPDYVAALGSHATAGGFRGVLAVPLLREGEAIGGIAVGRTEPGVFPDAQVALLRTFADQAVIAIENVRLFKALEARNRDLTEALEQQTATSEILRVISSSTTDVQPVFDTIAVAALKLCSASSALVTTYDGELIHIAADANLSQEGSDAWRKVFPRQPSRDMAITRAVLTRELVIIPDVLADDEYKVGETAVGTGFRSSLVVPLLREGNPIGTIGVGRPEPGPFPQKQIALLQTFADQAVIAIENVRLFTELKASTAQLTRSVGELKALGEVGQAVSSTLDLQTVLRTIVSRARELAGVDGASIFEYDAVHELFEIRATEGLPNDLVEAMRAVPIRKGEGVLGRLALTPEPVELADIADERAYQSSVREKLVGHGYRSVLAVPLLRENNLLGGFSVNHKKAGSFDPQIVELLKTFATQSALAIQNARLFREIEVKSRELETASRHKSEFLANMSHELRTPLNAIIGFSEVLSERVFGEINDKQAEYLADILESGRHLLSLINDILDLSKIEAGRMELEPSDFNLPNAIENTLILVRERAQRRGIALERKVDERLGTIRADERKVKQVLLNLLSNALKFTPEGGRIDVRAAPRDGVAEVSVTDTGVGIAPEDQSAVFEEFRQVGSSEKKVEGTGLGLAISRKFIELHGGTIRVDSEPGKGSTFTFTLPTN